METKLVFKSVEELLNRSRNCLMSLPWDKYGTNIKLIEADGARKYQGAMLVCHSADADMMRLWSFGSFPDRAESFKTVLAKIEALRLKRGIASLSLRDPPRVWGGAIWPFEQDVCWGLTGLPELADHIVMTKLLHYTGVIGASQHDLLLSNDLEGAEAARAKAGMSVDQYCDLAVEIEEIMLAVEM